VPQRDAESQIFVSRFSCLSEHSARVLANAILVAGLRPELRPPRLPGEPWRVWTPAELVATADNVGQLRQAMTDAAARAGATYEGSEPAE
jgi:hypothetical protein